MIPRGGRSSRRRLTTWNTQPRTLPYREKMTRDQLKDRTTKLRDDLRALILEFEDETGAAVSNIEVNRVSTTTKDGSASLLGSIVVEVERVEVCV